MRGSPVALVLTTVDAPMLSVAALAAAAAAAAAVTAFGTMSTSFTLHVLVADLSVLATSDSDDIIPELSTTASFIGGRCCLDELTMPGKVTAHELGSMERVDLKLLPDSDLTVDAASMFRSTADFNLSFSPLLLLISGIAASDLLRGGSLLFCSSPPVAEHTTVGLAQPPSTEGESMLRRSACINEASVNRLHQRMN